jgi:multifunctional 2-oxoglutarate metabolism enzyme
VGAAIVKNMAASLEVPTATSFRNVPAKLLEVNRKVINGYRARAGMGKVSFTHLIGYAIIRAVAEAVPNMKNGFVEGSDGKPRLVRNEHVNMGLAVDVDKGDGTRTLVVPVLKHADTLDFSGFLAAYEEIIRKVKSNKLTLDDFAGANITLTNPGTIGTVQSVPRLMPGQGVIVGVGNIDYPAEFEGADRRNLSSLGISKVVTITSTYDHRIIQGAESGLFLKRVHELLLGEHGFYQEIFHDLDMPYEAVKWRPDLNPIDREEAMLSKQMAVAKLIRVHRVRGHLLADLDPLRWKEPHTPVELDPATYGLTIWDLDREFLTDGVGGRDKMTLGELLGVLRDAYCRTIGVEYMHIQNTEEQALDPGAGRGQAADAQQGPEGSHPRTPQRRRGVREVPRRPSTSAPSGSASKGPSRRSRSSTRSSPTPPTTGSTVRCSAWRTAGASTCSPTSWARATRRSSRSSRGTSTRTRAGVRRRQVPPRRGPASTRARSVPTSRSSWRRTRRTSRRSTRS